MSTNRRTSSPTHSNWPGRQTQAAAHGDAFAEFLAGAIRPGQLHRRTHLRRPESFREQFANLNQEQVFETLKARLKPVCHRTLRRQVTAYIPYTKRLPLVEEFTPEESEDRLYHLVSEYLQRDNLQALPASQRSLMTLVLRKLLASSTFAIAGALTSISNRLKAKLRKQEPAESLEDELDQDYEALDETAEEWTDDEPVERLYRRRPPGA
jgi:predicted AAA+ superfamily ATPase